MKSVSSIKTWSDALEEGSKAIWAEIDLLLDIDKKYINNSEKEASKQESK